MSASGFCRLTGFITPAFTNFTVGADIRDNVSLTDDHEKGERDLTALTILGSLTFHY